MKSFITFSLLSYVCQFDGLFGPDEGAEPELAHSARVALQDADVTFFSPGSAPVQLEFPEPLPVAYQEGRQIYILAAVAEDP